jgi:Flp pilus assembly protein TadD
MSMGRIHPVRTAIASVVCAAIWCGTAVGQPAGADRPRPGESAEDLVATALQKIDTGDYEQAAVLLQKARRLKPTLPKLSLAEGLLLMSRRPPMYSEAMQRLTEYTASEEGRNDYRGFAALGTIYKESRMHRQARRPLEQAKKLAPMEENGKFVKAEITMDLAFTYLGLDLKKEALETAKEAESAAPNDPKIQFGIAKVAASTDDSAGAEAAAKKAIDILKAKIQAQPFDNDAHATLANCYDLLIKLKRTALTVSPDDGALYQALASATRESADVGRRITLLTARQYAIQATEKEPKKYEWQVFAARIEADLGAYQEATQRLEGVLKDSPDNTEATKLLESFPSQPGAARSK